MDQERIMIACSVVLLIAANMMEPDSPPRLAKRRRIKPRVDYWQSKWGQNLLHLREMRREMPDVGDAAAEEDFRRRFRVPFMFFEQKLIVMREKGGFMGAEKDAAGRPAVPLEFRFMLMLRVMGRGWLFDDVAEVTGIGTSTAHYLFHQFMRRYVDVFYNEHVYMPRSVEERDAVEAQYRLKGFPGCLGSIDCVHISWIRSPHALRHEYTNGKNKFPSLVFEVLVDMDGVVMHCTPGFPGTFADCTISGHDYALKELRTNPLYTEYPFGLESADDGFEQERGMYFICDNVRCRRIHHLSLCASSDLVPVVGLPSVKGYDAA